MTPRIPYIPPPKWRLDFLADLPGLGTFVDRAHPPVIKPFWPLVISGTLLATWVTLRRIRERGLDVRQARSMVVWALVPAFVLGHIASAVFYYPTMLLSDPWFLFRTWEGLSSFGGFFGAAFGLHLWSRVHKAPMLEYFDVGLSAFPIGWAFGRFGCSLAHDHPGRVSDAWFAVQFPPPAWSAPGTPAAGRFDLGLYEFVVTLVLCGLTTLLWRRNPHRPPGYYLGLLGLIYAPIRFGFDFLREAGPNIYGSDRRYAALTPGQWACLALMVVSLNFWVKARRSKPDMVRPA